MYKTRKTRFVLIALLMLGWFSYPLLSIANRPVIIHGIPLLFWYVMGTWLLGILLVLLNVIAKK